MAKQVHIRVEDEVYDELVEYSTVRGQSIQPVHPFASHLPFASLSG